MDSFNSSNLAEGEITISLPALEKLARQKETPAFSDPEFRADDRELSVTFTNNKAGRIRLRLRIAGIRITRESATARLYLISAEHLGSSVMNFLAGALMSTGLESKLVGLIPGPVKITPDSDPGFYRADFTELLRKKKILPGDAEADSCRTARDSICLHFVIRDLL